MRRRVLLAAALLAVAAGMETASPANRLRASLQRELDRLVADSGAPGATLALIGGDGREVLLSSGCSDREAGRPMTPQTRMLAGSVGKTFVAALVLQLAAQRQLGLDDPLSSYLGGRTWYGRLPNAGAIRIRHLLAHTSGLPEHVDSPDLWREVRARPDRVWRPEELVSFILDRSPLHPAGRGFAYADTNYILLGMVLERVTGRTYYRELQRRILGPLRLRDTLPAVTRNLPGAASGYSELGEPFGLAGKVTVDGVYRFNPQLEWTGGGLLSTSADLARWARRLYAGTVVSASWLTEMTTPVKVPTDLPDHAGYGLGTIVWQSAFGRTLGHSGFAPGYNTVLEYLPERHLAVALQCNSDAAFRRASGSAHAAASRFLAIALAVGWPPDPGAR